MVRLAGEGLRSVGVEPPSPHPRASALSCPSLAIYGPGNSLVRQPRPAPRFYSQRRANRYSPQTIVRAPTTASAASTQKSIASMHSPLSLAVGYNTIVTHSRGACNNVVAILANALYCPWPRFPSFLARPMLCPFQWLRRIVDDAAMSAPGGSNHRRLS